MFTTPGSCRSWASALSASDGPGGALPDFAIARQPRIVFGAGRIGELPGFVSGFGTRALLVVRASGPAGGEAADEVRSALESAGMELAIERVSGEPSPELVDGIVARARATGSPGSRRAGHRPVPAASPFDVVVGIGGGSVLDTAKAVAGLLIPGNSVMDHLEGVGPQLPYAGPAVPFVAVPTTAGTGSEVTKNAVLSSRGHGGFKRSFRDDALVARVAILDPDLLSGCPPDLIAGNGMDAVTQLVEAYVSSRANPYTDALALSGLAAARDGLPTWYAEARAGRGAEGGGSPAAAARALMAYAALCSGICLANAGLGAVHGLASPLGARFPIPHGMACGATLVATTRRNLAALAARSPDGPALRRYADVGRVLCESGRPPSAPLLDEEARSALVAVLEEWRSRLEVPSLSAFGVGEADIPAIVADSRGSSMRTNPITLTDEEIAGILRASL